MPLSADACHAQISAGGLVSALLGIQQNCDICWIGWPGVALPEADQPMLTGAKALSHALLRRPAYLSCVSFSPAAALAKESCIPVYLDAEMVRPVAAWMCHLSPRRKPYLSPSD
jgi:hypothetical protein